MHHGAEEETEFFLHLPLFVLLEVLKCQAADFGDALDRVHSRLSWLDEFADEALNQSFVENVVVGDP